MPKEPPINWQVEDKTERYIFEVNPRARNFDLISPAFGDIHTLMFIVQCIMTAIYLSPTADPFDRETSRLQLEAMAKICKERIAIMKQTGRMPKDTVIPR